MPQADNLTRGAAAGRQRRWPHALAVGGLLALPGGVYLLTLAPGVGRGDSAELQYMSPLLGICHPPGYVTEVLCGRLFSLLPIGANVAWRINLLMAVCGTLGCLALYGTVRRITGRVLPALAAATTLGFSSIWWSHSLLAEAYVFYGSLLLAAVYCLTRLVETNGARWLCLTALALGICLTGRPSELFVMPGFVGLWAATRAKVRFNARRLAAGAALLVLPLAFSVGYITWRENPRLLHARDDALRQQILAARSPHPRSTPQRLGQALYYALGLKWTLGNIPASATAPQVAEAYGRHLVGLSLLGSSRTPAQPDAGPGGPAPSSAGPSAREAELGVGVSIGPLGLVLAVVAAACRRRRVGWVLLGAGMFLGNLAFILWHPQEDALTFTVPGLSGLALLAGLGIDRLLVAARQAWRGAGCALAILAPLFLLVANHQVVDRATPKERARQQAYLHLARAPLPPNSVVLTDYWSGMTLRYLFHIEAGRTDVRVLNVRPANWRQVAEHLERQHVPTYITPSFSRTLPPQATAVLRRRTPAPLVTVGLLRWTPTDQP